METKGIYMHHAGDLEKPRREGDERLITLAEEAQKPAITRHVKKYKWLSDVINEQGKKLKKEITDIEDREWQESIRAITNANMDNTTGHILGKWYYDDTVAKTHEKRRLQSWKRAKQNAQTRGAEIDHSLHENDRDPTKPISEYYIETEQCQECKQRHTANYDMTIQVQLTKKNPDKIWWIDNPGTDHIAIRNTTSVTQNLLQDMQTTHINNIPVNEMNENVVDALDGARNITIQAHATITVPNKTALITPAQMMNHYEKIYIISKKESNTQLEHSNIAKKALLTTPIMTCQVQETDGEWKAVTVYNHPHSKKAIILHFGNEEYEGLDGNYTYKSAKLHDGDGEIIRHKNPTNVTKATYRNITDEAEDADETDTDEEIPRQYIGRITAAEKRNSRQDKPHQRSVR